MTPGSPGTPRPMPPPLPEVAGVRHDFLDLATGVRAHVAEAGPRDATPVLCLHGWPQHWLIWRRLIAALGDEARLICPDMRGFGWSGQPADDDFRKRRLAEDALAILDALGIDRAHVIGHDWGGWTGYLLAIDAPERVRSLLALGIPHPWQPPVRVARNLWRLAYQLPVVAPLAGPRVMRSEWFTVRVLRGGWGDMATWDDGAADSYAAALSDPAQARAASRVYRSFQLQEAGPGMAGGFAGKRLAVPTRLLYGRRDPLGTALAKGIERHGDDASLELLEGCGHFVPEERPQVVAERARSLFAAA
jgi:pimeloyl-ACP methyl ester carboxylesterase